MELVDMKQSQTEKNAQESLASVDQSKYPWGLQLNIHTEQMDKLGMKALPKVGSKFKLEAIVEVVSASMREGQDKEINKDCGLQITAMGLGAVPDKKKADAKVLYEG